MVEYRNISDCYLDLELNLCRNENLSTEILNSYFHCITNEPFALNYLKALISLFVSICYLDIHVLLYDPLKIRCIQ